ncbi:hypothetical protein [Anaerostipes faecalis]|uniref:hypothetical protein n=1 Tax=Anaerostipes faecalis TaxID=2738446 RepID=UPI001C1E49FE|nr:hypothetical protein [Anaerostipes faecalis]
MKKVYQHPQVIVEEFAPNEYVATCGDTEYGKYKFVCDAGGGRYGGLYDLNWKQISNYSSSFHACDKTHESDTDGDYILGYFDPDRNHNNGNEISVYIWQEKNRWGQVINRHATTNLDRDSWEITRS